MYSENNFWKLSGGNFIVQVLINFLVANRFENSAEHLDYFGKPKKCFQDNRHCRDKNLMYS